LRSPPLNHIYLWSVWIDKLNAPRLEARGHPHPLPEVFLRITHISETILSILSKLCPNVPWVQSSFLFQSYVRYVCGPKKGPRGGLKWLIILIFKNLVLWTNPNNPVVILRFAILTRDSADRERSIIRVTCEPAMPEDWYLAHNIDKSWKKESSLTKWFWLATRLLHLWCFLYFSCNDVF
jgi:hypothetical protein